MVALGAAFPCANLQFSIRSFGKLHVNYMALNTLYDAWYKASANDDCVMLIGQASPPGFTTLSVGPDLPGIYQRVLPRSQRMRDR